MRREGRTAEGTAEGMAAMNSTAAPAAASTLDEVELTSQHSIQEDIDLGSRAIRSGENPGFSMGFMQAQPILDHLYTALHHLTPFI